MDAGLTDTQFVQARIRESWRNAVRRGSARMHCGDAQSRTAGACLHRRDFVLPRPHSLKTRAG
jgi:hypothetical protein